MFSGMQLRVALISTGERKGTMWNASHGLTFSFRISALPVMCVKFMVFGPTNNSVQKAFELVKSVRR